MNTNEHEYKFANLRMVLDCGSALPLFHGGTVAAKRQRTGAVQDADALNPCLSVPICS